MAESEDRTESASARRLQKAREEGDVPVSREVPLFAGLAAGCLTLALQLAGAPDAVLRWLAARLSAPASGAAQALPQAAGDLARAVGPVLLAATAMVVAVGAVQTGFLFRPQALRPDFSRISPARGLRRLISPDTAVQTLKACLKLAVLGAALYAALRRLLPGLAGVLAWPPGGLLRRATGEASRLALWLIGVQALVALGDLAWVRLQHARRLRMSRQEQRDEHKETEGNPLVKHRMRALARGRARRRMMAAVRRAAVVVTNPEHYAVALAYERGSRSAPRVVAKGADELAHRIRAEAREHRIPIVANPPLARALYRVELDAEIPLEHFKAVAEIVAFIWGLRPRPRR